MISTIRMMRIAKGWSQAEASAHANLTPGTWSKFENDRNPNGATFRTFIKIAAAFEITPIVLILLCFNKLVIKISEERMLFYFQNRRINFSGELTNRNYLTIMHMMGKPIRNYESPKK